MPQANRSEDQRFYRVAIQRFEDARFLFLGEHYACSIYISGYAVECGLKALILSLVPRGHQTTEVSLFRGSGWHNLIRLNENYIDRGGPRHPSEVAEPFSFVCSEWTTDIRYTPGERPFREAKRFFDSTEVVMKWIKGRL